MFTRAQLHRRRSHLARAWDLHIPAICDQQSTSAQQAGVRTEIMASWERSAAHVMPEVHEAPLADADETRLAWQTSPLHAAVRQLEAQLRAAADDGDLVVAVTECVFNAALHGGARRAVIRLSYGGAVALCIADDGRGKPEAIRKVIRGEVPGTGGGYHTGLFDIAARAEEMGWTLRAGRSDLGGIAMLVVAPAAATGDTLGGSDG
ncbi:MAG: hypothetical protein ACRDP5_08435 [Streptosporangiaceae bacterium]